MTAHTGTMTNEERLQKTIRLEKVDKILSCPSIQQFAATYTGISQKDYLDPVKAEEANERTFNELGGWDLLSIFPPPGSPSGFALKTLLPGRDLPDNSPLQICEEELMQVDDYDFVIQNGLNALFQRLALRAGQVLPSPEESTRLAIGGKKYMRDFVKKWQARGVAFIVGGFAGSHPFEFLSFHRSLAKFSLDVHRTPAKVKAAIEACLPDFIANARTSVEMSGCRRVCVPNARAAAVYINSRIFEDLVLPTWLEFVRVMDAEDTDVIFHCDSNWTRFLPYFKQFPRGRCVIQLDGTTDIFKAKEILKDHMAIFGDVPAPLLSLGTPAEVTAYCQKLITQVGEGGGFILGSGCSVPYDAKVENVRAMVQAGNELTWY
jgi:hypothetical protein